MTTQRKRKGGARLAQPEPRSARRTRSASRRAYDGEYDESYEVRRTVRKQGKKARRRRGRGWMVFLVVVLAVVLCGAAYRLWAHAPDLPASADGGLPGEEGGTQPRLTGNRKENFYTFLIVGRDTGGGGNTDTIMLAAYDAGNQQAALMSIPRDTMVNVSWDVKKINSVYNMNKSGGEEAAVQALESAVADLVGFRPDFTVILEWESVGEIVNAIGGVYFDVPFDMYYEDWSQGLYINQQAGYRLLMGEDAMQVVRWRKNNCGVPNPPGTDGSDLGRTQVQQDFIAAVVKQCLQIKNITHINEIARVFTDYVQTELTVGNLVWFAEQAMLGGFSTENIYSCTMPNTPKSVYSRSYGAKLSYVVPDSGELLQIVNQYFNPYQTDVTLANLDIMSVDESGSISASSGTVRDSGAG